MVPLKTPAAAILLNTPGLPSPPIRVVPARPTGPSASLRFGRAVGFLFHRRKRTSQTP
jgi:hypothetical protein